MYKIIYNYFKTIKSFSDNAKIFLFSFFIFSISQGAYLTIFNLYLLNGGLNVALIGKILSFSGIGSAILAFPAGVLSDKKGRKFFILLSSLLSPLFFFIQSITLNLKILLISSFIYGASNSILFIMINPFLADSSNKDERVILLTSNFILSNIGIFIGSFLSGKIGLIFSKDNFFSLRFSLIIFSILLIIPPFLLIKIKEDKKEYLKIETKNITKFDYKVGIKIIVQNLLIGFGAGIMIPFLNLFFSKTYNLSPDVIGYIFSLQAFSFLFFGFFSPFFSKRVGLLKSIIFFETLSIPFLTILSFKPPLNIAVISFLIRGGLMNAVSPIFGTLTMNLISEKFRGTISSFSSLFDHSMRALGTFLGGILIYKYGFSLNFYLTGIVYSLSIYLLYISFKNYKI